MHGLRFAYKILARKCTGEGTLGRAGRGWRDNIRMNYSEIGCSIVDRIHVAQERAT